MLIAASLVTLSIYPIQLGGSQLKNSSKESYLTVAAPHQPSSGLFILANELRLWKNYDLELTIGWYPSGSRAISEGLNTGAYDLAVAADIPFVNAVLEGHNYTTIGAIFSHDNINRVITNRNKGIKHIGELQSRKLGTEQFSAIHFFLDQALSIEEVVPAEYKFLKIEELLPALVNGKVDAISIREPFVTEAGILLREHAVVLSSPGAYYQHELLVTHSVTAPKKRQALKQLLQALLDAESFCINNPEEAKSIIARALSADKHLISGNCLLHYRINLNQALVRQIEMQAKWLISQKNLPNSETTPNFLEHIDPSYLSEQAQDRVSIIW